MNPVVGVILLPPAILAAAPPTAATVAAAAVPVVGLLLEGGRLGSEERTCHHTCRAVARRNIEPYRTILRYPITMVISYSTPIRPPANEEAS
jgi:hypothetical protein